MSLLDQRQAADYLHVSTRTLERLRVSGDGPAYVKLGHLVRYRLGDLEKWIAAHCVCSTSQPMNGED
jgi:predicted DNA-binding transcriptional regulator AlpA